MANIIDGKAVSASVKQEVADEAAKLRDEKGIAIMISSHILDELAKVADCFGIINEGTLLDEFSADELHHRCGRYIMIRTDNPAGTAGLL